MLEPVSITRPLKSVQPENEDAGIFTIVPLIVSVLPLATVPVNAPAADITDGGKVMFVKAVQFANAFDSNVAMLEPVSTISPFKLTQPENEDAGIFAMVPPILKLVQLLNAVLLIDTTDGVKLSDVNLVQPENALAFIVALLVAEIVTTDKLVQPVNEFEPNVAILAPSVTALKRQPVNELAGILAMVPPIVSVLSFANVPLNEPSYMPVVDVAVEIDVRLKGRLIYVKLLQSTNTF